MFTLTPIIGYIRSIVGDGNMFPGEGILDELPDIFKVKSRRIVVILTSPPCLLGSVINNMNDSIAFLDCKSICHQNKKWNEIVEVRHYELYDTYTRRQLLVQPAKSDCILFRLGGREVTRNFINQRRFIEWQVMVNRLLIRDVLGELL